MTQGGVIMLKKVYGKLWIIYLFLFGINLIFNSIDSAKNNTVEMDATITSINLYLTGSDIGDYYKIGLEYVVDGTVFQDTRVLRSSQVEIREWRPGMNGYSTRLKKPGDKISIRINPEKPEQFTTSSVDADLSTFYFGIVYMVLLCIICSIVFILRRSTKSHANSSDC